MLFRYLFFFILMLTCCNAVAQHQKRESLRPETYKAAIRIMAKAKGDSIILRWGPTNNWAWTAMNRVGYLIERIDLSDPHQPKRQILNSTPIKPMTLDQFKSAFSKNDSYAAVAAQCLYGKNFSANVRKGQGGLQDRASVWTDRFGFAMQAADFEARVAAAEGLRYTDTHVRDGGIYIYRIYAAVAPSNGKIDTGNLMIENRIAVKPGRPKLSEAIATDRMAELHWNRSQPEQYSGYQVERSEDGTRFTSLTKVPFFSSRPDSTTAKNDSVQKKIFRLLISNQIYVDSLPRNYHTYYYRIRGINAFAEWSDYSDTLTASGLDLTAPSAAILANPKICRKQKHQVAMEKALEGK